MVFILFVLQAFINKKRARYTYSFNQSYSLTKVLNDSLVSTMSPINWLTQLLSLSLS